MLHTIRHLTTFSFTIFLFSFLLPLLLFHPTPSHASSPNGPNEPAPRTVNLTIRTILSGETNIPITLFPSATGGLYLGAKVIPADERLYAAAYAGGQRPKSVECGFFHAERSERAIMLPFDFTPAMPIASKVRIVCVAGA